MSIATTSRPNRRRQRGMTLLEIMIVLAILALVVGLVLVPTLSETQSEAKGEAAKILVQKVANEGYANWARKATEQCPSSLQPIAEAMGKKDLKDPWGKELLFYCGPNLPAAAKPALFAAQSVGADGQPNTQDDVKSWE